MLYLMSDYHGEYNMFIKMLKLINFCDTDKLIILGDVIDRGPDSIMLLQYVMGQPNIELLLGNHEEMMMLSVCFGNMMMYNCWLNNGGRSTLDQFKLLSNDRQLEIKQYLRSLPLYKIVDNFILVHAGIDPVYPEPTLLNINAYMDAQKRETLLWCRDEFVGEPALSNFKVIFGHTPTGCCLDIIGQPRLSSAKIWHDSGKIGIDCGACFRGGRLGCLRLDDMEEFYIERG